MVLRRRNDRIRLGKTLAQFEYQGKLERMRLPRLEQEEFYRRYSIFEKNTFNRSGSSFYRTKIGNRSWAPKHHSKDKFFRSLNQMKVEKTILTSSKTDIVQTFQKQSKKFILRSSSSNPAFRGVSQKGKTTRLYNNFLLAKIKMKNLANQERRAKYLANDLADTFTSDKFKNRAMYELKCWKNKFKSQFMDLRKEQVAVDECAEKLQEKLTKLNLRMRELTNRTRAMEKASGIAVASVFKKETKIPKIKDEYEETIEMISKNPFNDTYKD